MEVSSNALCRDQQFELLGGGDHTLTRELQHVLQTVLPLLGPVEVFTSLESHREQRVTLFSFKRHLLHSLLEDLIFLCQNVQGLHGLLVEIVGLGVRLGVFLVCGAWAPFPVTSSIVLSQPAGAGPLTFGAGASSPSQKEQRSANSQSVQEHQCT